MVIRARLAAPAPQPAQTWPWHRAQYATVPASLLFARERRMEAEAYLSSGFALRVAMEAKKGWRRVDAYASVVMPGRLRGIEVDRRVGVPYLAATQVFDVRPIPRRWLAVGRTGGASDLFVPQGTILVTRSGNVGRPTIAYEAIAGSVVSDDLLRVHPLDPLNRGWIYAYLRAKQARAMTRTAQYGHIIKHLETGHLGSLPIPTIPSDVAMSFALKCDAIIEFRNKAYLNTRSAEELFETKVGLPTINDWGESGFHGRASNMFLRGRRRFDASAHNPAVRAIRDHFRGNGLSSTTIAEGGYDVWLPNRFRRIPADDGILLVDSADLTEENPEFSKRIADGDFGDPYRGRVVAGWVLMARSGQTYGIIGSLALAGPGLEHHVVSDHVMRIKPRPNAEIPPGYLVTAMSHPILGRPLVKALAYGSSIPEIDVADIANFPLVRLPAESEHAVAAYAQAAADARADADGIERELTQDAEALIEAFLA
jgi:hypothetical protein